MTVASAPAADPSVRFQPNFRIAVSFADDCRERLDSGIGFEAPY